MCSWTRKADTSGSERDLDPEMAVFTAEVKRLILIMASQVLKRGFLRLWLRNSFTHVPTFHGFPQLIVSRPMSSQEPYRNRYTHFRSAYPGKPDIVYFVYVAGTFSLLLFIALGGGIYLDDLESKYIEEKQKERKKSGCKTAECQAKTSPKSINGGFSSSEEDDDDHVKETEVDSKKKRVGFRDRKFIAYEDRIRAYSTPDKIFRYFATLKVVDEDGETIYMTPDDFVRSITPGLKQPYGLDLDSFKRYDPKTNMVYYKGEVDHLNLDIPKESVFYRLCDKALISFTDFVFLLVILSTPRRLFEIAFRMFDLNGDGELDVEEFDVVRAVIMDTTAMGRRHRDHSTTGSTLKQRSNSALQRYFFGPECDKKLSVKRFLELHSELQEEITRLEFNRASPVDGKITEVQFSNFLLTYAGFSEQKRRKMIRRVKQKFPKSEESVGISYRDFADFNLLLRSISDVDTALTFHHMAGAAIDQATLKHVAQTVANVNLSPHLINVVFTLFDENVSKMAPRTQPLHRKNSLTTANGDSSLALVLEDYEVFEAEAAELSIEEVDDFSSSLLLDVENATTSGGAYGGHEMCELATLVTRNFHPVLSAHSLATTSVVTPTHHAHTAEYKLLTVTGNSRLPCAAAPHLGVDSHVPRSDGVEWNGFGHEAPYLPVHMLAAVSHGGHPCLPSSWPEQLLAYTDAPALVNAIRSDLIAVCNRIHQTSSIHVIPCDRAPGLTTCQLTCCEASVEWCSTEYGVGAAAKATAATGPSTSVDQIDRKRTFTHKEVCGKMCL
ncbi:putative mitochondrial aspartate/glutamate carrier protein [Fasciola hepatica]|uniref:Mitochondrial aspartate/glutamate carrier protein n=1 Tax=Fasciola hepatica TaxID=6192 RepID=A0A4E0R481_FASHE|nr:putative mitochondrial aspartate/glutamate carrier protein [Fasciola hepatica]